MECPNCHTTDAGKWNAIYKGEYAFWVKSATDTTVTANLSSLAMASGDFVAINCNNCGQRFEMSGNDVLQEW